MKTYVCHFFNYFTDSRPENPSPGTIVYAGFKFAAKQIKTSFYRSIEEKKIISSIGAIGLIATTIKLFQELEDRKTNDVIIMEDDIHFHSAWKYMIKPLKSCLDDVDLLYLGGHVVGHTF